MIKSFISTLIFMVLFYSSAKPQEISYGDSVSLWSGSIKSWMKTDSAGNPGSVGFTFTEDALKNLPSQSTLTNSLNFPKNASDTLFSHMQFIWLPDGHGLQGPIYSKPHFTDHIFIRSKQEQEAITGTKIYKVDPQFVPAGYQSSEYSVPNAGVHWFDTTGAEYHGEVFTKTLIYGYYKGEISFYEIAASKAYLETHPHFTGSIKQPEKFHKKGYYPTAYKIDYDSVKHVFIYGLTDFVLRKATPTEIPAANLQLWLKSDAGVVLNGSKVSRWIDQSGNENDAVEPDTSRQPMFLGYYNINNKPVPVISFDGMNDRLGFIGSKKMSQISLFMVFKNNEGAQSNQLPPGFVLTFGPGGSYKHEEHFALLMRGANNSDNDVIIGCGDGANYVTASSPNVAKYDEWRNMSIIRETTLKTSLRWNGIDATIQPTGIDFPISIPLGDSSASGGGIGSEDNFSNEGVRVLAKCDVAEIIVYDTVLSASNRLAVENYLQKKYNITITGVENSQNKNIPEKIALYQNYPNPFNPSTTIEFEIPKSGRVKIELFDLSGKRILDILDEIRPAGHYKINIDLGYLATGIYFYKLRFGKSDVTKKMLLVK